MTLPKTDDVRKAREQAVSAVTGVFEQVRTPLLAALGAGDLAAQAVRDTVAKARGQVTERTEAAREAAQDLPTDLSSLRERLDPAEMRKLIDEYTGAALKMYHKLAEHGEDTIARLRAQPQIKRAIEQLEEAAETAQERMDAVTTDARDLADEMLARMSRRARSVGEKTAHKAERVADAAAGAVEELGEEVAHEVRSASRKVASRTTPEPRKAPVRATRTTRTTKSTGTAKGGK